MSQPIIDRSSERIGETWRQEDHDALVHVLRELDKLVMGIYESHNPPAAFLKQPAPILSLEGK